MQWKFLSNLAFLLFVNLLVKPIWIFGIDRAVQNEVGASVYGSYFALFNFAFILNVFLDLGISNFNNRNISQHQHLLGKYFPRIVVLRLILAVFYFSICLTIGLLMDYSASQILMLALLCFNQFLLSFILFLRSNIAGLQLFRIDSMLSVMDRLIMILSCGWVLFIMQRNEPFNIEWFVYLQTIAYLLTTIFAFGVVLKKGSSFTIKWNPAMLVLILKQSLPYALLILLMSIYGRADSVLLERLLSDGKQQTGIYAQAFRLLDAVNMIAYLFAVLLLPMFSRMLKVKEDIKPLAQMASKLLLIPALCLGIICWNFGGEIMNLLYESHAHESGKIVSLLMLSLAPIAGAYIFGTLLTANGNLKQLNFIALTGVFINFSLNLVLIPKQGAYGAALVCLITQVVTFSLQLFIAIGKFKFKADSSLLLLVAPMILLVICGHWTSSLDWMAGSVLLLGLGGFLTVASLVPDMKVIRSMTNK